MKQWIVWLMVSAMVVMSGCGGGGGGSPSGTTPPPSGTDGGVTPPPSEGGGGLPVTGADTTPPVITLNGSEAIALKLGEAYVEAGASATDNVDGVLAVAITGGVDTTTVGSYTLTYSATDKAGNKATRTRVVSVVAQNAVITPVVNILLNTENLKLGNIGDYKIVTSQGETNATSLTIEGEKNLSDAMALIDENDTVLLIGRKFAGDESVDISVRSSAYAMVLMHPDFAGRESNDPKELQKRIQAHPRFDALVEAIQSAINEAHPNPLDPIGNYRAFNIVGEIMVDLKIDDLYSTEGGN